jgi:hypothetical protein
MALSINRERPDIALIFGLCFFWRCPDVIDRSIKTVHQISAITRTIVKYV